MADIDNNNNTCLSLELGLVAYPANTMTACHCILEAHNAYFPMASTCIFLGMNELYLG